MKIIQPQDLQAADLPGLESPFFALEKARSFIQKDPNLNLERLLGRPATYGLGARAFNQQRNAHIENVLREIRDGRLLLVFDSIDGAPSSPVVRWREGERGEGRWKVTEAGVDPEIIAGVNALNQHVITPGDLSAQGSMGVGSLPSGYFAMEYRLKQREQALRQDVRSGGAASSFSNNVLPVSASTKTTESSTTEAPPEIHLEIGIFTDGTLNNAENSRELEERVATECVEAFERGEISLEECEYRLSLALGGSYANAPSNVAKLRDLYGTSVKAGHNGSHHRFWVYTPGIGTKTGQADSLVGSVSGMGETGIVSQTERACKEIALQIGSRELGSTITSVTFDLFGFSRGAAAARHIAYEITRGAGGALGRAFVKERLAWPESISIRFVGLFDTVAAVINPAALDFRPDNERNAPVNVYLDPSNVQQAVHLVAEDEYRENFALNSLRDEDGALPANFTEISLPGAHSDIGGGYPVSQREDVLISPFHLIPSERNRWPEQTMEWDSLEALMANKRSEGWVGRYSLPVSKSDEHAPSPRSLKDDGPAEISVYKEISSHPAPDGRVELALRMVRQILGGYSRVPLQIMHGLALKAGAPFLDLDSSETRVPRELLPIAEDMLEQIAAGAAKVSLAPDQRDLIRQRYTHYSAHYNPLKTGLFGATATLRFGRNFSPNAPEASGQRTIYPNRREV